MIDGTSLPYADTTVSVDKSKQEINDLLKNGVPQAYNGCGLSPIIVGRR